MIVGAWICLAAPLAGAILITLFGESMSRRTAGWLSTLSVFVGFGGALATFIGLLGRDAEEREAVTTGWTWLATADFTFDFSLLVDPLAATMMLIVTGVGGLIVLYSIGYMDGDPEERRYFAYMSLFVFSMLLLVQAGNFLHPARRLGARRPRLVPADRLLAREARGGRRCEEGVRDERGRRRDDGARILRPDLADRDARLRAGVRGRGWDVEHARQSRRARPARRCGCEVCADPDPHLAPGCDGRPDARVGADPRGDDGDRGRLPDRARPPDLRAGAARGRSRRGARHPDAARRGAGRARAGRHQARDRVLDHVADRLHVPRRRPGRVRERDVPPDDARLLQGAALPRGRHRHPPSRRRAGHPAHGRAAPRAAANVCGVPRRLARARRHAATVRFLLEGRDPRLGARERLVRTAALRRRPGRGAADRDLHVPAPLRRLPRRAVPTRARARAPPRPRRGAADDDLPGRGADGAGGDRRLGSDRGHLASVRGVARSDRLRPRAPGSRRADRDSGLRHERARRGSRPDRDRGRLDAVRRPAPARAALAGGAEDARAQVLVRRALRRASSTGPQSCSPAFSAAASRNR